MSRLQRVKQIPTWRKLAMATWRAPDDPTVYGSVDVDMTLAMEYIRRLRREHGEKVTVTHLVGKAVADAIAEVPEINGIISLSRLYLRDTVDIFFQINTVEEGRDELSGKKIERVNEKDLVVLAREFREQAYAVKTHQDPELQKTKRMMRHMPAWLMRPAFKIISFAMFALGLDLTWLGLKPDPFGSAMITSVGMLGIDNGLAPLISLYKVPLIVVVGAVREKPAVVDGQVVPRLMMTISGSFDHRFIDGAHAARLIAAARRRIENPEKAYGPPERLVAAGARAREAASAPPASATPAGLAPEAAEAPALTAAAPPALAQENAAAAAGDSGLPREF